MEEEFEQGGFLSFIFFLFKEVLFIFVVYFEFLLNKGVYDLKKYKSYRFVDLIIGMVVRDIYEVL